MVHLLAMPPHLSKRRFARSHWTAAAKYAEITTNKRFAIKCHESINYQSWGSIGATCEPKCGYCCCGNYRPGGKKITLAEVRERTWSEKASLMLLRTNTAKNHIGTQRIPGRRIWHPCQITKEHRKLADAEQAYMLDQQSRDMIINWNGPVW